MTSKEPPEWRELVIGHGDGVTTEFSTSVPWPVEPETFSVYIVPPSLLDKLIALEDRPPVVFPKKPQLTENTLQLWETSGSMRVHFANPPKLGTTVEVRYQWRPPRLRNHKVRVQAPDGTEEWVTFDELQDTLDRRGGCTDLKDGRDS